MPAPKKYPDELRDRAVHPRRPPPIASLGSTGVEDEVRERFGAAGIAPERISCERATWRFEHPGSPAELLATFRDYYGPTMNAFAAAAADGREDDLQRELGALFEAQNESAEGTSIPATYLKVTVALKVGQARRQARPRAPPRRGIDPSAAASPHPLERTGDTWYSYYL